MPKDVDKSPLVFYGTPGLVLFTSFGDTPHRGAIAIRDFIYTVHRGTFWEVNNAGVRINRGSLNTTSGRVSLSSNGQQIGITDGVNMYVYVINQTPVAISTITHVTTTATVTTTEAHSRVTGETITISGATPAAYNGTFLITVTSPTTFTYTMLSDPGVNASVVGSYVVDSAFVVVSSGLFPAPADITFQDGYFLDIFTRSGQFQISASYDGTQWDGLDFATAESNPDDLVRIIADHGEIVLLGGETTEFWGNSGNLDFPYANIKGATIEFGLAAKWSLTKFDDSLIGLFKNRMGQVNVMRQVGHQVIKVSTNELDYLINNYPSVDDATGFSYMLGGHPMYQINFPIAGKSWLYDGSTGLWTILESGLNGMRHRGEFLVDYLNKPRVFDYENGNIYTLDPDVYTDNGDPIVREIVSKHYFQQFKRIRVRSIQIDCETGVGLESGQGSDPQMMLKISRDNGHTWGNELWRPMGKIGQYLRRVIWRRLGGTQGDMVFKFRITDPVKVVIAAASLEAEVTQ